LLFGGEFLFVGGQLDLTGEPIFFSFGKKAPWRIIKKEEIPQAKSRRSG
jgi:hypothetical protein